MMAMMSRESSDCAIGWNAADEVLKGLELFADEYQSHIRDDILAIRPFGCLRSNAPVARTLLGG